MEAGPAKGRLFYRISLKNKGSRPGWRETAFVLLSAGCCLADEVVVRAEALEGGAVELLLVVGMG